MENLIQMSQEIKEFATAFCAFQSEVSNPKTTEENPFFNSKYSDLANVLRTIKEPLVKNGLSILPGATTEERMVGASNEIQAIVCIETILLHLSGQYARYTLRIVADRFAQGLNAAGHHVLNDVVLNQVMVSFGSAERTLEVIGRVQRDGTCWCGGTVWQGRTAMRVSVSSWATTEADVERSLALILRIAEEQRQR